MLENVWFLSVITIIGIILSTSPKTSIGSQRNQFNMIFTSTSDSQNFIRPFTWFMIATFYLTTLVLSYVDID